MHKIEIDDEILVDKLRDFFIRYTYTDLFGENEISLMDIFGSDVNFSLFEFVNLFVSGIN